MLAKFTNQLLRRIGFPVRYEPNASNGKSLRKLFKRTQGMTSLKEVSLLYELAKQAKNGCIVEVGSYRGRSTVALGRGSMDGNQVPVFAIEPHEEFRGVLGGQFGPEDRGASSAPCWIPRVIRSSAWSILVAKLWRRSGPSPSGCYGSMAITVTKASNETLIAGHRI